MIPDNPSPGGTIDRVAQGVGIHRKVEFESKASELTPSEVITAWRAGAHYVKVFPCSAMGGAAI
jgi:hypothetical protein